jgi:hypothetical protein
MGPDITLFEARVPLIVTLALPFLSRTLGGLGRTLTG